MSKYFFQIAALLFFVNIGCGNAADKNDVVWQIGLFDKNYAEFAITDNLGRYNELFPNDVSFRPAVDDCGKSWPYIHPGNSDAWAGSRIHPFTINFDLESAPAGKFTLRIAFVSAHSSMPPKYRIDVNGLSDAIQLPAGTSDEDLGNPSTGKPYEITIDLSSKEFKKGRNKIVLTCEEGSWALYDAISLTNDQSYINQKVKIRSLDLIPTNRYVKRAGKLKQIVELNAVVSTGADKCLIEYRVGSSVKKLNVAPSLFGGISQELEIDELKEPAVIHAKLITSDESKSIEQEITPKKKWKIYVMPSSHVDVGYTDYQPNVADLHYNNTIKALDLMRKYKDFCWNMETTWATDYFLKTAPEDRRDEFIRRAKEGRIGCQVIYGSMLSGILSSEEQFRQLYDAKRLSNTYGIPFNMAVSSDVPTQIWTLPAALAASEIKYFASGINLTRGGSFIKMFNKSPFYWEGSDGSKVLTWLASGYGQAQMLGLIGSIYTTKRNVEVFIKEYTRADYPYDAIFAFGGFMDNYPMDDKLAKISEEWNKRYEYPKIVLCTGFEFFDYISSNYGSQIPVIRGDGGVYWEDGAASSAYETAITRLAKEDLVTVDKLYSITALNNDIVYPASQMSKAWNDIVMYDEHTWGSAASISDPESEPVRKQWAYKRAFALRGSENAAQLLNNAVKGLADSLNVNRKAVIVFNPHSWVSSGIASYSNGRTIYADNVPALGCKIYLDNESSGKVAQSVNLPVYIENNHYRVKVNANGSVSSIFDKELGRELVDTSAKYGVNQYLYVTGLGADAVDSANIKGIKAEYYRYSSSEEIQVTASALNTPSIKTTIRIYDKIKRIDFLNEIVKDSTYNKEAGYFAFPFAVNKPTYTLSYPNGSVSPNTDMLPGGCMSWYAVQDYASLYNDDCAITWSAIDSPLITIGDINRETFASPLPIDNGHLYAYVFNNYWFTNYKAAQSGKLLFRFAVTSAKKYDPIQAYRFGKSFRAPMLAVNGNSLEDSKMNEFESGFSVKPDGVIIQSIKKTEDGDGLLIRLMSVSNKPEQAVIALPKGIKKVWSSSGVEDKKLQIAIIDGKVEIDMAPRGIAAIIVE